MTTESTFIVTWKEVKSKKKKELVYLYPIADWVSDLMPQISKICPFHAHLTSYIFVISYVYVVWEECLHYSDTKVALSLV